jgi:hypothetical protein
MRVAQNALTEMSTKQYFIEPWNAIEEYPSSVGIALEREACIELAEDHPLHGLNLKAVARRDDCDDVLFQIAESDAVAVVHLTWSGKRERSPSPQVELYESIEAFRVQRMEVDASNWP